MRTEPENPRPKDATSAVVRVDLGTSSMKSELVKTLKLAGFRTVTDGLLTIVRDLNLGRIQYSNRELSSQQQLA